MTTAFSTFGLAAVLAATAGPAGAVITSIQNTDPLDLFPATVPGAQFGFTQKVIPGPGVDFDDLFTFDISGSNANGGGSATALSTAVAATITHEQFPIALRLLAWDGDGYDTELASSGVSLAPSVQHDLPPGVGGQAGHGFYALEVIGTTPPNARISQYSGQLQVAAIPEAHTWVSLVAGLGLVGWIARRRSVLSWA